ncbi:MAG: hypothetical protein A3I07_01815 [Candidatus Doudnabacteria bacterium RIFCSPLOWO2_02_FULL_42_9]|nr:MAG: hypothetical protein A2895_04010 [Candidatus Doudnabacteria bacterium RIFCSPLOWO2_01_FULL_42_60]OGF00192.1 MAG: hypothetical protein A3I07_01815 [Candidatus Doudnabacteria bacterium RIFCSPLOWO2_02_FULL_42_9]
MPKLTPTTLRLAKLVVVPAPPRLASLGARGSVLEKKEEVEKEKGGRTKDGWIRKIPLRPPPVAECLKKRPVEMCVWEVRKPASAYGERPETAIMS